MGNTEGKAGVPIVVYRNPVTTTAREVTIGRMLAGRSILPDGMVCSATIIEL